MRPRNESPIVLFRVQLDHIAASQQVAHKVVKQILVEPMPGIDTPAASLPELLSSDLERWGPTEWHSALGAVESSWMTVWWARGESSGPWICRCWTVGTRPPSPVHFHFDDRALVQQAARSSSKGSTSWLKSFTLAPQNYACSMGLQNHSKTRLQGQQTKNAQHGVHHGHGISPMLSSLPTC